MAKNRIGRIISSGKIKAEQLKKARAPKRERKMEEKILKRHLRERGKVS